MSDRKFRSDLAHRGRPCSHGMICMPGVQQDARSFQRQMLFF
ncbi:hypothetical protein L499_A3025 [Bordetella holmesii CDC-H635-BH]|uniref:Uncharacterized protein n=1 Tax=Bordetella holmesii CDC-H585-BH TaxID=1331206 RepID=A0A158M6B0_9BORD|nr:hypothetical protein D558_1357 [Bordetella holmesii 44057]KAK91203.1 hypothetical protein L497_3030 [Bordetella holmesii CDC-H585-BH]KAK97876.1 hypothetical protein L499_A3025 [Bordetella holmesii CDC-H635-BH]KCV06709.1 hypothetical protein L498_3120 [Bordetella holmesii CDC-H629-BH]